MQLCLSLPKHRGSVCWDQYPNKFPLFGDDKHAKEYAWKRKSIQLILGTKHKIDFPMIKSERNFPLNIALPSRVPRYRHSPSIVGHYSRAIQYLRKNDYTSLEELALYTPNFPLLTSSKDYNYRINRAMVQVIIVRQFIYILSIMRNMEWEQKKISLRLRRHNKR